MKGISVLSSWFFNQYIPDSKNIIGFSSRKKFFVYMCGLIMKMRYMILEICTILELCPSFSF